MMQSVQYIHLAPGTLPLGVKPTKSFSAVVIIEKEVQPEWRHLVSEWLVKNGCRCMMAWGRDCSLWDDSVDVANLEAFDWDVPDNRYVMTTWHNDDTLSDVLWHAKSSIFHPPEVSIDHLLILDISEKLRETEILDLYESSAV